jgi:glycosyltransferase involved in cell wall biosynthesis
MEKVSIIIATKNESKNIIRLLESIKKQTYSNIEIVVVDNHSTDDTITLASRYTPNVYTIGPERSAQRNYGVQKATGDFVLILDGDMELTPSVVQECVSTFNAHINDVAGITILEESMGTTFWAKCRILEKKLYSYDDNDFRAAARFYKKELFEKIGGFNVDLVSGEDWDLSQRAQGFGKLYTIKSVTYHYDGDLPLIKSMKKKFYYGRHIDKYLAISSNKDFSDKQMSIVGRYKVFLSQPKILFANPVVGVGVLFLKTCEFGALGFGYLFQKLKS